MQKNFDDWNEKKKGTNQLRQRRSFREREIWWIRLGINIGYEQDGKGHDFTRPVFILRKYGDTFFGIPLSSQEVRENRFRHRFQFGDRESDALLSQARVFDSKRLLRPMGRASKKVAREIKEAFIKSL